MAVLKPEFHGDPALRILSLLVGGTWRGRLPFGGREALIEARYEAALSGRAIRCLYVFDKGGPMETEGETLCGWDVAEKRPYVIECHFDNVLKGPLTVEEDRVLFHYASIVGPPVRFRAEVQVTEENTMRFSRYHEVDGTWEKQFSLTYARTD